MEGDRILMELINYGMVFVILLGIAIVIAGIALCAHLVHDLRKERPDASPFCYYWMGVASLVPIVLYLFALLIKYPVIFIVR